MCTSNHYDLNLFFFNFTYKQMINRRIIRRIRTPSPHPPTHARSIRKDISQSRVYLRKADNHWDIDSFTYLNHNQQIMMQIRFYVILQHITSSLYHFICILFILKETIIAWSKTTFCRSIPSFHSCEIMKIFQTMCKMSRVKYWGNRNGIAEPTLQNTMKSKWCR